MKPASPILLLAVLLLVAPGLSAADAPKSPPSPGAAQVAAPRHPLKGVVTQVYPDRSALMVKHEEIPGVMRAMTMMFTVDAATLQTVKTGDSITGLMSRQGTGWVLEGVKVTGRK